MFLSSAFAKTIIWTTFCNWLPETGRKSLHSSLSKLLKGKEYVGLIGPLCFYRSYFSQWVFDGIAQIVIGFLNGYFYPSPYLWFSLLVIIQEVQKHNVGSAVIIRPGNDHSTIFALCGMRGTYTAAFERGAAWSHINFQIFDWGWHCNDNGTSGGEETNLVIITAFGVLCVA